MVLEPPPELSSISAQSASGGQDKKREMLDQTADLKLAERYLEVAKKYNENFEVNKENIDDSNSKHVSFASPSSSSQQQQFESSPSLKPF